MKLDPTKFHSVRDAAFGYQTEDGLEVYPFEALEIMPAPSPSDDSVVYDASAFSTGFTYTIQLTPAQSWDLRCMLERWPVTFDYRDGWNKRITP